MDLTSVRLDYIIIKAKVVVYAGKINGQNLFFLSTCMNVVKVIACKIIV